MLYEHIIFEIYRFCANEPNVLLYLKLNGHANLITSKNTNWELVNAKIKNATEYSPLISTDFITNFYCKIRNQHRYIANLPDNSFYKQFENVLDWDFISIHRKYKEKDDFILQFKHKLNWAFFTKTKMQHFSIDFLDKYEKYVDWIWISTINQISVTFVEKYYGQLNLFIVLQYSNLPVEFVKNNHKLFEFDQLKVQKQEFIHDIFERYLFDNDADVVFDYLFDIFYQLDFNLVRTTKSYTKQSSSWKQMWLLRGSLVSWRATQFKKDILKKAQEAESDNSLIIHFFLVIIFVFLIYLN